MAESQTVFQAWIEVYHEMRSANHMKYVMCTEKHVFSEKKKSLQLAKNGFETISLS